MSEPFLEEQLRRIRQMSERISDARRREDELSKLIERNRCREHSNPFDDIRDFRAETPDSREQRPHHANDRPPRRRAAHTRHRR